MSLLNVPSVRSVHELHLLTAHTPVFWREGGEGRTAGDCRVPGRLEHLSTPTAARCAFPFHRQSKPHLVHEGIVQLLVDAKLAAGVGQLVVEGGPDVVLVHAVLAKGGGGAVLRRAKEAGAR